MADPVLRLPVALTMDVAFDLVCPWCWLGKHQLDTALAMWAQEQPQVAVRVRWQGVQLLPDLPVGGVDFKTFYTQRLGHWNAVLARQQQVHQALATAGLPVAYERITTMPNTALAHRLLRQLDRPGAGASDPRVAVLMEAMFKAYFVEGKDIGQADVLWRLAVAAGIGTDVLQAWRAAGDAPLPPGPLAGGAVPCFQGDGRFLLEGAQSPQLLLRALRSALHARTEEPSHA